MNEPGIQKTSAFRPTACFIALLIISGLNYAYASTPAGDIRLSRYTTQTAAPDPSEENPLAVIAHITFPRNEIKTVGDAVSYLLLRTGYTLLDSEQLDPKVSAILSRPLPESHRKLGTYSVEAMLKILMGKAFVLNVDALNRTVSYSPAATGTQVTEAQK